MKWLAVAAFVTPALAALGVVLAFGTGVATGASRHPDRRDDLHRRTTTPLDLVDVIELIAREVRSGRGVRDSLTDALRSAPSLLPASLAALDRRAPLLESIAAQVPRGDERDLLSHALRVGAQHTHVLPDVLDRTAALVRERRTWRREREAQAAQARSSALVLTILPLAFAGWGTLTSASVRAAYASSAVAAAVAGFGVCLNAAGWLWMRRLVRARS